MMTPIYKQGHIFAHAIEYSCDHEVQKRGLKPFAWYTCRCKKIVTTETRNGMDFHYCKKHSKVKHN